MWNYFLLEHSSVEKNPVIKGVIWLEKKLTISGWNFNYKWQKGGKG
jgi:hypothetical protein